MTTLCYPRTSRPSKRTIAIFAWLLATPAIGRSQSEPPQSVVMLAPKNLESIQAAVQAVQSQLSDLPVRLQVEWIERLDARMPDQVRVARRIASEQGAAVVFWCDFESTGQVFSYFYFPASERVLARSLEKSGEGGQQEALSLITRSLVRALVRGDQIEEEPEEPASPAPDSPSPDRHWLGIDLAYALQTQSSSSPATHGLHAALQVYLHPNLRLFVGYRLFGPVEGGDDAVSIRVQRHPVWLGLETAWGLGRFEIGGSVAFTLDAMTQDISASTAGYAIEPDQDDLLVSISPWFMGSLTLVSPLRLVVCLGAEVFLTQRRYLVEGPTGRQVLVSPWQVQPFLLVGLQLEFL